MSDSQRARIFRTEYRVPYADTDAGGVVYYGSYLRFFEIGRTELIRDAGFSVREFAGKGLLFPVVNVTVNYKTPAVYDDLLRIETGVTAVGRTSVTFASKVFRAEDAVLLVEGEVTIVCVDDGLKPKRMPVEIRSVLGEVRK